jgi:hypothetical protein
VIDEDDIERLIAELAPPAPSPVVVLQPPPADHASGARGGRPPEYDWEWVELQVRRRVYRYGLPEKSSVLVFEVLKLMGRNPPEQRTVERKLAQWWPKLEALWEDIIGPCEITPASNSRP